MNREAAKRLGWSVERISDSYGNDYVYYYYILVQPDGEFIEGGDYGYGWGDDTPEDAWARLPEDFANMEYRQ